MKNIELLSPVGDFDCLKAAIQNGADAVYLGSTAFNARYSAKNFGLEDLEMAINYAHIRNSKVYLTLNTLITTNELHDAFNLAKAAYNLGVDAIIVQDLGFANLLINTFPNLPIHASTQMTITNLNGAKLLENMGFKRVVLSRELSLENISYICKNSNIEIECFVHGALCISYSGQCLFSSMVGGRSGNRGKCAQACRLPYELIQNKKSIDKGYLLSPKDLCTLEFLPDLVNTGIHSFKIEGRMKTPEYVATVTKIYRKYIDIILEEKNFKIDTQDLVDLKQVFNRGGFSSGHLLKDANKKLIFKEKSNNMGIFIGNISNYNSKKGHVTIDLANSICLGDTISFEKEPSKYTISELIIKGKNIPSASCKQTATVGRMKGNIHNGDKVYKLSSKNLTINALSSFKNTEQKKVKLDASICIKESQPITFHISPKNIYENLKDIQILVKSDVAPIKAINFPVNKDRIISQLNKTTDTPFTFDKINVDLEDNLYIPNISILNKLRRDSLILLQKSIIEKYKKQSNLDFKLNYSPNNLSTLKKEVSISLLLNNLSLIEDYSNIKGINHIYIPLRYFLNPKYSGILSILCKNYNIYIYLPTIIKDNFENIFINIIERALKIYNIKGFVISNIGSIELLNKFSTSYELIGNFTLNIFNSETLNKYLKLGLKKVTLSPELNKENLLELTNKFNFQTEIIVYGALPLMTCNYCILGKSNKCYSDCPSYCNNKNKYYLKDRKGFHFRFIPDNTQTITTIYNSKITSISIDEFTCSNYRIDILDETISEINDIIQKVKTGKRLEGQQYTNGNLYRNI